MKEKHKNILKYLLFLGVAFFFVWLSIRNLSLADIAQIKNSFTRVHVWVIIPVFICGLLSHFSRAIRWQMLIKTIDKKPRFYNTFFAVMIGYLVNLAIPRLGEVFRCGIINKYEKTPIDKLIGTMLIERLVDIILLFVIIGITLITQFDTFLLYLAHQNASGNPINIPTWSPINSQGDIVTFNLFMFLLLLIIAVFVLQHMIKYTKYGHTIIEKLRGMKQGIFSINKVENKIAFWVHSLFIWLMYGTMMYFAFFSMDITQHLGIGACCVLLTFGSIGMSLTQGGLGAYPLLIASTLILYDIPYSPEGIAFGWIIWVAQTLIIIFLGFLSFILIRLFNHNNLDNVK